LGYIIAESLRHIDWVAGSFLDVRGGQYSMTTTDFIVKAFQA